MQRTYYKIILLSVLFSFYNCGKNEREKTVVPSDEHPGNTIQISQTQFETNQMHLGVLEEKLFPNTIQVSGIVDVPPENKAVVNASMGGYVKSMPFLEGDLIKKGQRLLTIENPEFVTLQQNYSEIHERLTFLKSEYERQKTMVAEKITSQKSFLKAESEYKTALATYNGLQAQLKLLHISPTSVEKGIITAVAPIYAPISGSITKVNVTKGSYVSPANPIVEIVDNSHIHLELSVFEKDIMSVKKGQKIKFNIPEASTENFTAKVHLVGSSIEENRTIKVHAHIENETDHRFLTGMFVEAFIITNSSRAKAVPDEAIVVVDEKAYVLILVKKEADIYHFEQRELQIGESSNGYTIVKDVERFSGTQFLTKGAFSLLRE
ncbi:nickel and cobalt resistance protein CnrB [Kordia sp. SMS9]|uniref:efflux RND transporter periplasmic adaptor subunit n=1 Tax=Kordia sp. SMS9 TaxID=2282170 RepID=UPI000E0CDCEC|nr:efflux RND transporter periplasmic adaptor subunit [Kordia sp. SMS9]AXG69820.1 nickel and cobalt resistance protein CnrB [Kordia sp. SMS9]